ncbi:MAG: putative manganese-dependent inorganic diphosphatase [Verrucomicrobia bacterium]|nr:putative manganese-dependent inorganic diphosphatase [Verrucomicrobiota bacterium]
MQTIVIGHKNPDMDSICSAIGYAELKRLTGNTDVIAARAGNTNERIDFVLRKFGMEAPVLITDLSPRVRDVMEDEVISITADSSIYEAIQLIERRQMRGVPVIDGQFRCLGLLSAFKVLHHLVPSREDTASARVVAASLEEIFHTFAGRMIQGEPALEEHDYLLLVGAMAKESFKKRVQRYQGRRIVVILGDREEIQLEAIRGGAAAVVVTGDTPVSAQILESAAKHGVTIATSPYDTATTVLLARGAVKVGRKLDSEFVSFSPNTLLAEAREEAAASAQFIFPVLEEERLVGILSKSDFLKTVQRQLILVDHNELSQAVAGADEVPIVEILDHHRLGGISTHAPILFWNHPVGSASSIVALCFEQLGVPIPKPIAGLLMAGLISDTLNLSSPTATPVDARILKKLAEIAETEPARLAEEIFSVGSPLLTMTPEQAISADCKEYTHGGERFSVAQIEEISFSHFHTKQAALTEALDAYCRGRGYLFSALLVTDINTQNSLLLVCGSEAFLQRIDYPRRGHNQWEMEGVVSRKKQLLPYLLDRLHGMPQ